MTGISASQTTLLVGSPGATQAKVRAALGSRAQLLGQSDGFYQVRVKNTSDARGVKERLQRAGIAFIFPDTAPLVDRGSYPSVKQHIAYIKARAKILGDDGESVRKTAGFFEALADYLETRIGPDGTVDQDLIRRAVAQRDQLPPAWIGSNAKAPSSVFTYVGPKNLATPQTTFFGTAPLSGRVNGLAYAPSNPNVIYLASAGGGVWKSTDQGMNWIFRSSGWSFLHTTCVAVHPTNEDLVLVGTGDYYGMFGAQTMGIMRSTNGGATWTQVGASQFGSNIVTRLIFNPDNPTVIIALTAGADGDIWRSTDSGVTWTPTNAPAGNWDDIDYGVFSNGTREFYAVGGNNVSGGRIYRSLDGGGTWTIVNDATSTVQTIMDVACSKKTFGKLWILHPNNDTIYRSSNGGASWTNLNLTSEPTFPNARDEDNPLYNWSQDTYDLFVETAISGDTEILYCGLITLASSTNDGNTWTDFGRSYQSNSRLHNDQHCFVPHPVNGAIGLVGNDGGVFRIFNMPGLNTSVVSLNSNLYTTQFYHMSLHPTDYNHHVMGGTQDNASPASRGNLTNWTNLFNGDGSWSAFQPSNPSIHYTSSQQGNVYRYTSLTDLEPDPISPEFWMSVNFIAPMVIAGNSQVLLGANFTVQRWTGVPGVWLTSPTNMISDVNTLAVGISNPNRVYAGCDNGSVFRSDDQGVNFVRIDDSPVPNSTIGAIACSWTNSTDVLVGIERPLGGLYRCTDTSVAVPVWTSVSGTGNTALPRSPVNAIMRDPHQSSVWYVGTDVGAFMTTDSGATWKNMNVLGLGNVHVNAFAIADAKNYLYVATFGRGIWRIPLVNNTFTSFTTTVSEVYGDQTLVGTVQVSLPAPPGTTVQLSTASPYVTLPPSVTINQGSTAAIFAIQTSQVFSSNKSAVLNATCFGTTRSVTLTLKPYPTVASLILSKTYLYGGTGTLGTASLSAPAPYVGSFAFTSSSPFVTVISPITIGVGEISKATNISTMKPTTVKTAVITAAYKGTTRTATLSVYPIPTITSFTFAPNPTLGGFWTTGTLTLSEPAPITTLVGIVETSPHIAITSPRIIQAGQSTLIINAHVYNPNQDQTVPIEAQIIGDTSPGTETTLQILRSELTSITCAPDPIRSGRKGVVTVNINRALPVNKGILLFSSNTSALKLPRSVTLVAGFTSVNATADALSVTSSTSVTIGASYLGVQVQRTVVVNP